VQAKAIQAGVYTVLPHSATDQMIYLYNVQPFQLTQTISSSRKLPVVRGAWLSPTDARILVTVTTAQP
jgi:hypothetical protein